MFKKLIIANIMKKPFKWIVQLWNYLNGKKTYIAFAIGVFGTSLNAIESQVLIGIWHQAPLLYLTQIVATCNWIAIRLGGVGILHKIAKAPLVTALTASAQEEKQ